MKRHTASPTSNSEACSTKTERVAGHLVDWVREVDLDIAWESPGCAEVARLAGGGADDRAANEGGANEDSDRVLEEWGSDMPQKVADGRDGVSKSPT